MRPLSNLNKEHDEKLKGEKMEQKVYELGGTVYTVKDYRIGKYTVAEVIRKESKEKTIIEYTIESPFGRKTLFTSESGKLFDNFDDAKAEAVQSWETIDATVRKQLDEMTDEALQKEIDTQKQNIKAQKKFEKNLKK